MIKILALNLGWRRRTRGCFKPTNTQTKKKKSQSTQWMHVKSLCTEIDTPTSKLTIKKADQNFFLLKKNCNRIQKISKYWILARNLGVES